MQKYSQKILLAVLVISLTAPFFADAVTIKPPVKWTNLKDLINKLIDFVFYIAVVVLPLVIMYGGFKFITAQGNPGEVDKAIKMMLYAGVGFGIMLIAKGAVALIDSIFINPPST